MERNRNHAGGLRSKLILFCAFCSLSSPSLAQERQEPHLARTHSTPPDLRQAITVGPNVQVSARNGDRAHEEVRIATDPASPQRLLVCSMVFSSKENATHTLIYASSDGGRSWAPTLESDRVEHSGDPDCVFGLDGSAYFVFLAHHDSGATAETRVYRSLNGGWKWEEPLVLPFIDRVYLTVDHTSEKYSGRIYLHGDALREQTVDGDARVVFTLFHSTDGGRTFLPPVKLLPDEDHMPFATGNGVVLSDGTFVALFPEWSERKNFQQTTPGKPVGTFKVVRSENGGSSFAKAAVVSPWYCPWSRCEGTSEGAILYGMPSLAADNSAGPFRDRLYAVWSDKQSDYCDIFFSYSVDKGRTWSLAKVINDEPDPFARGRMANHHMPVVAVNNAGVVAIAWYDGRDHPDGQGWWTRFTASLDGGETFLPSVAVSEAPEAHRPGEPIPIWTITSGGGNPAPNPKGEVIRTRILPHFGAYSGGDTAGIAVDANGVFHPVWVDNRTGILQVWTAPVTVAGKAIRNGGEDLAALADITESVALKFSNTNFDTRTGVLSLDATLTNISTTFLNSPIKVRVVGLRTGTGSVQITNADNRRTGTGAVWDYSDLLTGKILKPGQMTEAKRFEFHLTDIQPFRPNQYGKIVPELVNLETKVFGNVRAELPSERK